MTIAPSGRRSLPSWVRLIAFTTGALVGGVTAFGVMAGIGAAWTIPTSLAVGVVVVAGVWISVWHGTRSAFPPLPYRHGQVPRDWSKSLLGVTRFGAAMGLGVATNVSSGLVHLALLLTLLQGDLMIGVLAGAAFGLGRSAPVFLAFLIPSYPKDPTSYTQMLMRRYPPSSRMATNLLALAASVVAAAALMIGEPPGGP